MILDVFHAGVGKPYDSDQNNQFTAPTTFSQTDPRYICVIGGPFVVGKRACVESTNYFRSALNPRAFTGVNIDIGCK